MKIAKTAVILMIVTLFLSAEAQPTQNPAARTVWDSVYSEAQALRGEETFVAVCEECHDGQADGPLLDSDDFTNRWREDSLGPIFTYMKTKMPESDPGSLSDAEYLDLLAYILWLNKTPSGARDLTSEALTDIQFVGKDGPKPLPLGTLVYSVGCLSQIGGEQWVLTGATPPIRTRNIQETEETFKAFETRPLGTNRVRLDSARNAAMYKDSRVYTKGLFTLQDDVAGIEVMEIRPLMPACRP